MYLRFLLERHQTLSLYAPSRLSGVLVWGVIFPWTLLSFWVCYPHHQCGLDSRNSFPEFIPASHQYLLTVLSIWWALGQLLGSLVGLFLPPFIVPQLRLGCVATTRQLFLPDDLSPFSMSAFRERRLALLPLRNGWTHAFPLRASFLCLPSI